MMRFRSTALLILFCAATLAPSAHPDEAADKAKVERLLKQTAKEFLAVIDGVTQQQWSFKGNGIRHSIGEEAEHVSFAEQELQKVITTALKSNAQPGPAAALSGKEKQVRELMLEAEKGAENYRARGRINSRLEVLEYFGMAHDKLLQLLAGAQGLNTHVYKHPNKDYGDLTVLQWFYYIAYHKQRHIKQIEVIKAHPDFPGRVRKAWLGSEGHRAEVELATSPAAGVSPAGE